jgi:hypothetical protein
LTTIADAHTKLNDCVQKNMVATAQLERKIADLPKLVEPVAEKNEAPMYS